MAEDQRHKLVRYLKDAHAAEIGSIQGLQALANEATNSSLKSAVEEHIQQTRSQADRVEERIKSLNDSANGAKAAINSVVVFGSHIANAFHDSSDKQTQDTIKAISLEGFEIATYTALKSYSQAIGDDTTASLADTLISEEKAAHEKLLNLLPEIAIESALEAAVA